MGALRETAANTAQTTVVDSVHGRSERVGQSEREREIYESERVQDWKMKTPSILRRFSA